MNRVTFAGGIYPDARPSGAYAVPIPLQGVVKTHVGPIEFPSIEGRSPGLMFTRLTEAPSFKIAAKSHTTFNLWVWQGGGWTVDGRISTGTQGHIWTPEGSLFVVEPAPGAPSQGVQYWDNGPVYGHWTYNPFTDLARRLDVSEMYAWTYRDGIAIGQGASKAAGGGVVVQIDGKRRLLDTGPCTFIEFHRNGDAVSVAYCKPAEAVIVFATVADLAALPLYPDADVPTEPDKPTKPTEPTEPEVPHMEDKSAFVQSHPANAWLGLPKNADVGRDATLDRAYNAFRFVCAVARDLGAGWGVEKKPGGEIETIVDGVGYSGDILRTKAEGNDIVGDREGEGARSGWGTPGPAAVDGPKGFAVPPSDAAIVAEMKRRGLQPAGAEIPTETTKPTEPTEPTKPTQPGDPELAARVAGLEALTANLDKQLNDHDGGLKFAFENLVERVDAIEQAPPSGGGLTAAERKTLRDAQALLDALKDGVATSRYYGHAHKVQWGKK